MDSYCLVEPNDSVPAWQKRTFLSFYPILLPLSIEDPTSLNGLSASSPAFHFNTENNANCWICHVPRYQPKYNVLKIKPCRRQWHARQRQVHCKPVEIHSIFTVNLVLIISYIWVSSEVLIEESPHLKPMLVSYTPLKKNILICVVLMMCQREIDRAFPTHSSQGKDRKICVQSKASSIYLLRWSYSRPGSGPTIGCEYTDIRKWKFCHL